MDQGFLGFKLCLFKLDYNFLRCLKKHPFDVDTKNSFFFFSIFEIRRREDNLWPYELLYVSQVRTLYMKRKNKPIYQTTKSADVGAQ
jgi:hypothetical protein